MVINESAQNYLETIYILSQSLSAVRAVDIASKLNYKKSSVSVAMKNLKSLNYITITDTGFILLTKEGHLIAEALYERHTLLTLWLENLGVDPLIASQDACKIEHIISQESFEAIKKHLFNTQHD